MNKSIKEQIEELILEGKNVKEKNYTTPSPGVIMPPYIEGNEYDVWMNRIKLFSTRYLKEYPLYNEIVKNYESRNNQWGTAAYDKMMNFLSTIAGDDDFLVKTGVTSTEEKKNVTSEKLLFISHSSLDIDYVKPLVSLLEDIGFRGRGSLFCSSLSGYWIPTGEDIYNYLKTQFDKEIYVILILSDNYYSSPACMNEMGATWIKSKKHTAILVPGFNYSQMTGAIDASKIWFKLNDKERLNEFKSELIVDFDFNEIDQNIWERKRDSYIEIINEIFNSNKFKNFKQQIEVEEVLPNGTDEVKCVLRFINKDRTPQVCKYVDIILNDYNSKSIKINIPYNILQQHVIHGNENKRIVIDIPKSPISGIDEFDLFRLRTWSVDSQWSSFTG